MILPDVNVLIHAFRPDSSQHSVCRAWLAGVVSAAARFGLSPLVLSAVVPITPTPGLSGRRVKSMMRSGFARI